MIWNTDYENAWCLDLKFLMAGTYTPYIPLKSMKSLAIFRTNSWLMQKHGLGTDSDKICEDITSTNAPNTSQHQVQETWKFFFLTYIQLCVL